METKNNRQEKDPLPQLFVDMKKTMAFKFMTKL